MTYEARMRPNEKFGVKNLQLIADKICIITASMRQRVRALGN